MFDNIPKLECVSEIVKKAKERDAHMITIAVDTRCLLGVVAKPQLDKPFLGEDIDIILMNEVFNRIRTHRWNWIKNSSCKHIRISLDITNKVCRLQNRDGENISYKQFRYQSGR
ncbi:hypothetical protein COPG_00105 [Colwellia phage 9A]|uniref:Uncharacterized protein n=1 Tax=Colwellia phage 9A TaxID=765765 RepID=I3UMI6_9CAUD|nr:hypothetical protein COPG_00105 [Colwellia phage 9A]AFK66701.1 hypothetical protein COPG_00105 [Colwellia phage 9A]